MFKRAIKKVVCIPTKKKKTVCWLSKQVVLAVVDFEEIRRKSTLTLVAIGDLGAIVVIIKGFQNCRIFGFPSVVKRLINQGRAFEWASGDPGAIVVLNKGFQNFRIFEFPSVVKRSINQGRAFEWASGDPGAIVVINKGCQNCRIFVFPLVVKRLINQRRAFEWARVFLVGGLERSSRNNKIDSGVARN